MSQKSINETLKKTIKHLPRESGVYLFQDGKAKVIYVGKAKDLRNRVSSYLREGADGRYHIQFLLARAESLEYIVTGSEQEALILENNLIKKHRPRYNIFLRDDKTYVHVRLNVDHRFPRFTVVRRPRKDKARYFGPYASAGSVRSTLRMLGKIFPMRTCADAELANRKRPCLYHYIKRCPAPCVGFVDEQAYRETVTRVTMFLKGRGEELVKSLTDRMERKAAERQYEEAAKIRDQLFSLRRTLEKKRVTSSRAAERDVIGVHREKQRLAIQILFVRDSQLSGGVSHYFENASLPTGEHLSSFLSQYYQSGAAIPGEVVVGEPIEDPGVLETYLSGRRDGTVKIITPKRGERRRLLELASKNARAVLADRGGSTRHKENLEELQDMFELEHYPRRIECFDVSNLQGKDAVASRVTFIEGEQAKTLYRHYRIRTVQGADDCRMMGEVLERRIVRGIKEKDLPDLLLVDGGKGQLNVALGVLDRLGVEGLGVLGIAKGRGADRRRRVRGKERIFSPRIPEPLLLEGNMGAHGAHGALHLLERSRGEAHRFAITYHKKLRSKRLENSVIDAVPGVGPVLKRRLLRAFGSLAGIREASIPELSSIQGVSRALAARIDEFLEHRP